jgi:hypothetical protein
MKLTSYTLAGALAAALVGCGQGNRQATDSAGSPSESQPSGVKPNTSVPSPAAPSSGANLVDEKNAILALAERELKECNARMEDWAKKAGGYAGDAKTEADKALAALREKSKSAEAKCEDLQRSSKETWQQIREQFNTAMSDFKKALEEAKSKFSS